MFRWIAIFIFNILLLAPVNAEQVIIYNCDRQLTYQTAREIFTFKPNRSDRLNIRIYSRAITSDIHMQFIMEFFAMSSYRYSQSIQDSPKKYTLIVGDDEAIFNVMMIPNSISYVDSLSLGKLSKDKLTNIKILRSE